jgi:hypothetical protein
MGVFGMENCVGVIQQVLVGPEYDKVYDLVLTDKRLILVYLEPYHPKFSTLPVMDARGYLRQSMDELTMRPGNLGLMFWDVKRVETKPSQGSDAYVVIIKYTDSSAVDRKLKIEVYGRVDSYVDLFREKPDVPTKILEDENEDNVKTLLTKAFPSRVLHLDD